MNARCHTINARCHAQRRNSCLAITGAAVVIGVAAGVGTLAKIGYDVVADQIDRHDERESTDARQREAAERIIREREEHEKKKK